MALLYMNGGEGDMSYANNSLLPEKIMSMSWPIVKEAIRDFCSDTFPTTLTIADLGCASGPNAFRVVFNIIKEVEDIRQKLHKKPIEYQISLNDLHENDFNVIFRLLPSSLENLKTQIENGDDLGPCLFNGVPGSYFGRLFPTQSLHFFHSISSLFWLSEVPKDVENYNKGSIFIHSASSKIVREAFYMQFQKDFSNFLKHREKELIRGGRMVLTFIGCTNEDQSKKEGNKAWELLDLAVKTMVSEGIIEEEKVDSFNIMKYMPSPLEVEAEVSNDGNFTINSLQVSRLNWDFFNTEFNMDSGYYFAKLIRVMLEPLFVRHFGEAIIEELFYRYQKNVTNHLSKENGGFTIITVSLTKN